MLIFVTRTAAVLAVLRFLTLFLNLLNTINYLFSLPPRRVPRDNGGAEAFRN